MKRIFSVFLILGIILISNSAYAGTKSGPVNAVTQKNAMFTTFGRIESGLLKSGPQLSATLTDVSGQLFSYLAIIALVMFSVKELMFGDKGIKEFMIFFLFLMFAGRFASSHARAALGRSTSKIKKLTIR